MNLLLLVLISTANLGKHIAPIKMQAVHMFLSGTGVRGFYKDCVSERKRREYISILLFLAKKFPQDFFSVHFAKNTCNAAVASGKCCLLTMDTLCLDILCFHLRPA